LFQAERDDLASRLKAAESVKDFLMNKLQETETALKQCTDEKELGKRQAASDQEVITFLDARTQEMEKVAAEAMNKVCMQSIYSVCSYTYLFMSSATVSIMCSVRLYCSAHASG
jgi:hypothetical protein